jgi:hypothetical protein
LILAGWTPTPSPGDCEVAAIRLRCKTGNRMLPRWQHPILIEDPNEHRKRAASLECEWKPGDSRRGDHLASGKAESARRKARLCRIPQPAARERNGLRQRGIWISPFPVSPSGGKPGRGGFPPRRRQAARQRRGRRVWIRGLCERRWHASRRRLPPQEGFQTASLKPPLCIPPLQGSLWPAAQGRRLFLIFA